MTTTTKCKKLESCVSTCMKIYNIDGSINHDVGINDAINTFILNISKYECTKNISKMAYIKQKIISKLSIDKNKFENYLNSLETCCVCGK